MKKLQTDRLEVWEARWNSTINLLDILITHADAISDNFDKVVIIGMLNHLKVFGKEHFYFFFNGFKQNSYGFAPNYIDAEMEEKAGEYSAEYVLRNIIRRVYDDVVRIENVIQQRLMHTSGKTKFENTYGL